MLHPSVPTTQQVALRVGGRDLLTLHADRFITWRLNGANKLATDSVMLEHVLGTESVWKIYKDSGDLDSIAISNRWFDIS